MKSKIKNIIFSQVVLQIIFWFAFYIKEVFHRLEYASNYDAYISATLETLVFAFLINFNYYILLPKYFEAKKYFRYILIFVSLGIICTHTLTAIEYYFFIDEKFLDKLEIMGRFNPYVSILLFKLVPLINITFLTTVYYMFKQKSKVEIELKELKTNSELKLLKSQINPHFLFNALNNVYTLSYLNSTQTPQMILKLSEMLRYVLYECSEEKVTLEKEIDYIQNYVAFQKLKSDHEEIISVNLKNIDHSLRIAPMLFMPFIENSFKHSKIDSHCEGWINLEMSTKNKTVYFNISNSLPCEDCKKNKKHGIGLENAKRRLELLYKDKHKIEVTKESDKFSVKMEIELE